jgi:nucleoside-diphosphate-sugar epimerase
MHKFITLTGSSGFIGTAVRKDIKYPYNEVDCLIGKDHKDIVGKKGTLIFLSAWVDQGESFVNPVKYIQNNLTYFSMVLINNDFDEVIFSSSCMVYDKDGNLEPSSVYGLTKLAGEKLIKIYCDKYWILRIGNPYGPNDRRSVFCELARCKRTGDTFVIYGGKAIRDFFPVGHVADVINRILDGDIPPGIYNVCSGNPVVTSEYLKAFCETHNIRYTLMDGTGLLAPGYATKENVIACNQKEITEEEWKLYLQSK